MNGFTKLVFFPITAENTDALPTYGDAVKIYSGDLTNNIRFEVTPNYVTATRRADDVVEEKEKMQNYSATLEVYGMDSDGTSDVLGFKKDANGNFIIQPNDNAKNFGIFFETKEQNTDKRMQAYYYKANISPMLPSGQTDEKGDPVAMTLNIKGSLVKVDGKDTVGALVVEGQSGFVATGLPTTMYVEDVEIEEEEA